MTGKCEGPRMKFVWKTRMKVQRSLKTSSVLLFISGQIYSGYLAFISPRQQLLSVFFFFSRPKREVVTTEIFTSGTQCKCWQKTKKIFSWVKYGIFYSVSECCADIKYLLQNFKTIKTLLCSTDVTRVATLFYIKWTILSAPDWLVVDYWFTFECFWLVVDRWRLCCLKQLDLNGNLWFIL